MKITKFERGAAVQNLSGEVPHLRGCPLARTGAAGGPTRTERTEREREGATNPLLKIFREVQWCPILVTDRSRHLK